MSIDEHVVNIPNTNMTFKTKLKNAILHDFYIKNEKSSDSLRQLIFKMIIDAHKDGIDNVYIGCLHDNIILKRIIEDIGFVPCNHFIKLKFLWFIKELSYAPESVTL